MIKNQSPDSPFIWHYEMGLFLTFSVFELQRGYLYQNGVEFRHKVIGLNLFWGHLHYFSGGLRTFPSLSDTRASALIAEHAIILQMTVVLTTDFLFLFLEPGELIENLNFGGFCCPP